MGPRRNRNPGKLLHQALKGKTGAAGRKKGRSSLGQKQGTLQVSQTGETFKIPARRRRDRFHSELHNILRDGFHFHLMFTPSKKKNPLQWLVTG